MPRLMSPLPQFESSNGIFEVEIDPSLITITRPEIIMSLGYSNGDIDRHFDDRITGLLLDMPENCTLRAGYRVLDVDKTILPPNGLQVNGVFLDLQRVVTSQLKRSEKIALFACTIGAGMEDLSKRLFSDGDAVGSHFADTIASGAAEKTAQLLHDHIKTVMAQQGLKITNRYSPGYCGWSVAEQKKLFSFFPGGFCGITLNDSSLMSPVKSVSGIIGIGPAVTNTPYLCGRCGQKNCTHREYTNACDKRALSIE